MRKAGYSAVFTLLVGLGCYGEGEPATPHASLALTFGKEGPTDCGGAAVSAGTLPQDADFLVARVLDSNGQERYSATVTREELVDTDEYLLSGIAPGTYELDVTGCRLMDDGGVQATWRGQSESFDVHESRKVAPLVFMLHRQAAMCVGGSNVSPFSEFSGEQFQSDGATAFSAVATDPKTGHLYISGGFVEVAETGSEARLRAGTRLFEFRPEIGLFNRVVNSKTGEWLELAEPRAMHFSVESGGYLVLAGGVLEANAGSSGYPGKNAPLDVVEPPENQVEVLSLQDGSRWQGSFTNGVGIPQVSVAGQGKKWLVLGGGRTASGAITDEVAFVRLEPAAFGAPDMTVLTGKMARPRFGGVALGLSTGRALFLGGYDGTEALGPELVVPDEGAEGVHSGLANGFVLEGFEPTVFPSAVTLHDDGKLLRVLVVGGNAVESGAITTPPGSSTYLFTMQGDGKSYDMATIAVRPVEGAEFDRRSYAGIARAGDLLVLGGGFTAFTSSLCPDSDGVLWADYCFPWDVVFFDIDVDQARVVVQRDFKDGQARLGAVVTSLGGHRTLIFGGLTGVGQVPEGIHQLTSNGYVFAANSYFDDVLCNANPQRE